MGCWSPENATNAYITTLKMEGSEKEPNAAAFISALAAGNNAQLMVASSSDLAMLNPTLLLALLAASLQTGGQVICILPTQQELQSTQNALRSSSDNDANNFIEFVVGNSSQLILLEDKYKKADFLLIHSSISNYDEIIEARKGDERSGVVVGYNAFSKGSSWQWSGLGTQLLPIGDGLLVTKVGGHYRDLVIRDERGIIRRKSNWIVKVDKCTGEEHVFRVRPTHKKLQVAV